MKLDAQSGNAPSSTSEFPSLTLEEPIRRGEIIQSLLDLFEQPNYLEVGVQKGKTFNSVVAPSKVAVDPKFRFDHESAAREVSGASFYEVTSDEFFGGIASRHAPFDLIYLDGMHTSEQTIRDLLNAIVHLSPHGVIAIDDVFPSSYLASLPNHSDFRLMHKATAETSGAWMGDVFRLVFFVETFCQQFSYATVNDNHGQLILWREPRGPVPDRTLAEVAGKAYKDVYLENGAFRFAPFKDIIERLRLARN